MTALDPVYTIGEQIAETLVQHRDLDRAGVRRRARELLDLVQVPSPERCLGSYPHEISGGMRQRAMIAIALACEPELLLADEPTTALDVTVQAQILWLLRDLQKRLDLAVIFVTHDLGVAAEIADDAAVMYAGRIVEQAPIRELFHRPAHPYTAGLMQATTLTFVIVASQVGLATGHISTTTSASILAAGLLSAAVFPGAAMRLLIHGRLPAGTPPGGSLAGTADQPVTDVQPEA
jgi:ABC-type dipeptide/oligopeptide/nickel transport system ATPase component